MINFIVKKNTTMHTHHYAFIIHHSKTLIAILLCFPLWLSAMSFTSVAGDSSRVPCEHGRLLLKKNTLIPLRVEGRVEGSKHQTGDIVMLSVDKSVGENGIALISPGRLAQARLTVTPAGRFGRPGKVRLEPLFVETVDGQLIELSGGVLEQSGKNDLIAGVIGTGAIVPIVCVLLQAPILFPLAAAGVFIKGREAVIPTDAYLVAKVKHDVYICP
jgi:hypothetical protein